MATLAETGKMEGNIVSRVRKSVLILAAKYKYKLNNLFFAQVFTHPLNLNIDFSHAM